MLVAGVEAGPRAKCPCMEMAWTGVWQWGLKSGFWLCKKASLGWKHELGLTISPKYLRPWPCPGIVNQLPQNRLRPLTSLFASLLCFYFLLFRVSRQPLKTRRFHMRNGFPALSIQCPGHPRPVFLPGNMTSVYLGMCIFWGEGLCLYQIFTGEGRSMTPLKIRTMVEEEYWVTMEAVHEIISKKSYKGILTI